MQNFTTLLRHVSTPFKIKNSFFNYTEGTKWFGKCWYIHDLLKYEFDVEFDVSRVKLASDEFVNLTQNCNVFPRTPKIPVTYPVTAPEIALPELDGKTAKMYRGGKICLTDHFKPLWGRNVPKFGLAHLMALGVSVFFFCSKNLVILLEFRFSWLHGWPLKYPI